MKPKPTIKDVASAAGVSIATVSYVLNGKRKVSEKIRLHVQSVAQEIGYSRNAAAHALKTGRNNIIGMIFPSLSNLAFTELARYAQDYAKQKGYACIIVDSGNEHLNEANTLELMQRHGIDGALALLHPSFKRSENTLLPIVSLDAAFEGVDSVQADHFEGGRLMAEHLYTLGHRKVGFALGSQYLSSSLARRAGFLTGAKNKLDVVCQSELNEAYSLPPRAQKMLLAGEITAFGCINDLIAVGILNALTELGLECPKDVSIIGFDDISWAKLPLYRLSTLHYSIKTLSEQAVDLLISRIEAPVMPHRSITLPVHVVARSSTAAPSSLPKD